MGFAAALGRRRLLALGEDGRPLLWCRLARMGMEADLRLHNVPVLGDLRALERVARPSRRRMW